MNSNVTIDSLISEMGKVTEQPSILFCDSEVEEASILEMVNKRIAVLMTRKHITQLEINMLEVLLKHPGIG